MNPQFISDDLLIADFFSGGLTGGDREEFLAAHCGDADRLQLLREFIHKNEIAERFLRDDLSESELAAFEQICIADPSLFDELLVLEQAKQGLVDLASAGKLHSNARGSRWPKVFRSPQYAVAASVLLIVSVIVSGFLLRDNVSLRADRNLMASGTSTRLVPLLTLRGGAANTVQIPGGDEWTVLLVDPGLLGYDSYRATLRRMDDGGDQTVLELSDLELTYDAQLAIGLPGDSLTIGDYQIVIEGLDSDTPVDASYERISTVSMQIVAPNEP